jgi:hypothetical protein
MDLSTIRAVLEGCENALANGRIRESDALALVKEIDDCRRRLDVDGYASRIAA